VLSSSWKEAHIQAAALLELRSLRNSWATLTCVKLRDVSTATKTASISEEE
jgi:hypothetical protein